MRKLRISACIWFLLILLIYSGCEQAMTRHDGNELYESPASSDDTVMSITSNGEATLPYLHWAWANSWIETGWIAADALQLDYTLQDIAQELPTVSYHEDFTMKYEEGVSFSYMLVLDADFKRISHLAEYDELDHLTYLKELPEGTYYVGIAVVKQGRYIEKESKYEYSGFDCVFKLVVEKHEVQNGEIAESSFPTQFEDIATVSPEINHPGLVADVFQTVLRWCEIDKKLTVAEETDLFRFDAAQKDDRCIDQVYSVTLSDDSIIGWVRYTQSIDQQNSDMVENMHYEIAAIAKERGMPVEFYDGFNKTYFFISPVAKDILGYFFRSIEGFYPEIVDN